VSDQTKMHVSYKIASVNGNKSKVVMEPVMVMDSPANAFPDAETKMTKQEMIDKLMIEIGRYAKRQMTWWRRNKTIEWLDLTACQKLAKRLYLVTRGDNATGQRLRTPRACVEAFLPLFVRLH